MNGQKSGVGPAARGTGSNSTGPQLGETGYLEKPQKSYALDRQFDEPKPPAVAEQRSTSVQTMSAPFPTLSPLPPSQPIKVILPNGKQRTAMALVDRSELSLVQDRIAMLEEELTPVDPLVLGARLRVLFAHYGQMLPTEQTLLTAVIADWMNDMQDVSAKAFDAAVTSWRQSKERFKPTPGQILAITREMETPLRRQLERCFELEWVATKTRPERPTGQGD